MLTSRARFAVIAVALIVLAWTIYEQAYQVSSLVGLGLAYLVWSYFRDGTVVMAAKAFHQKDYIKTEALLKDIRYPEQLRRSRRGYYEFIYGNIELQRQDYEEAERHFQFASRYKLKNENDRAIVLVQLANLNLRKKQYDRVKAYIEKARELKISSRVEQIIQKLEKEIQNHSE